VGTTNIEHDHDCLGNLYASRLFGPHPDLVSLDLPSPARAGEGQATVGRGGEGQVAKCAIVACMHKILVIVNAMIKSGTLWQADYASTSS